MSRDVIALPCGCKEDAETGIPLVRCGEHTVGKVRRARLISAFLDMAVELDLAGRELGSQPLLRASKAAKDLATITGEPSE